MNSWIQTFSGEKVDPLNPDPRTLHIVDIAESLSKQCRFTGHLSRFYSTARHSINCVKVMQLQRRAWGSDIELASRYKIMNRSMLLHDASEAYLSDIARPVKHSGQLGDYALIEARLELAICERFRTEDPKGTWYKFPDNVMLRKEAEKLFAKPPIDLWHHTLPDFEGFSDMPKDWFVSEPVKDCNEFLDLYGQYQY